MSSRYLNHALTEFRAAGWLDEHGNFNDAAQEEICNHVIALLNTFANGMHSDSSAFYTIDLFEKLAKLAPIAPLTGEDWEWVDVSSYGNSDTLYQNKRCSSVFKDKSGAWNIDGIIFWDWFVDKKTGKKHKIYYTCAESNVPVKFPYNKPKRSKTKYRKSSGE